MEAQPKPAQPNASQPQKAIQMGACSAAFTSWRPAEPSDKKKKNTFTDALNPAATTSNQQQHVEHQHKARRLRGGGAGRVRPSLPGPVQSHFPPPLCTISPSFAPFTTPPFERPLTPSSSRLGS
jgi:hypothetical protein